VAGGFFGRQPGEEEARALAAVAAFVHFRSQKRAVLISGALDNHRRTVGREWVVKVNGTEFEVSLRDEGGATLVGFGDGRPVPVTSDWLPGRPHARFCRRRPRDGRQGPAGQFRLAPALARHRLKIHVRSPRVAELARLMPEKAPPDTSKMLLCPMPGVVTAIMVEVGAEVQEGQPLATVEAMKMENVLRAERRAIVKSIPVEAGASLAVDEMIMEFE
jgi:propionyl-CoA carboxylase alpha chain